MIRREIGFAFDAVDDEPLGLSARRHREFHMRGERGAPHADDARRLDLSDDLLRRERTLFHDRIREVDARGPLVALAADRDRRLTQSLPVDGHVHGRNGT